MTAPPTGPAPMTDSELSQWSAERRRDHVVIRDAAGNVRHKSKHELTVVYLALAMQRCDELEAEVDRLKGELAKAVKPDEVAYYATNADELVDVTRRLTAQRDTALAERDKLHTALSEQRVISHEWCEQALAAGKDRDAALAQVAVMREACEECLSAVDDCYKNTGHFRVAKTSEQRLKIDAALSGTAANALLSKRDQLRVIADQETWAYAVFCKPGSEFDYRVFADRDAAQSFWVNHYDEEGDPEEPEIIELVPRQLRAEVERLRKETP